MGLSQIHSSNFMESLFRSYIEYNATKRDKIFLKKWKNGLCTRLSFTLVPFHRLRFYSIHLFLLWSYPLSYNHRLHVQPDLNYMRRIRLMKRMRTECSASEFVSPLDRSQDMVYRALQQTLTIVEFFCEKNRNDFDGIRTTEHWIMKAAR